MVAKPLKPFVDHLISQTRLTEPECEAALSQAGKTEIVHIGHPVVRTGQISQSTCVVLEGFCGRYNTFKNGERQISAIYVCGDAPDLYSVFQPIAAFDLEALTDLTIFRIPHSETRRLIEDFPAITEAFARYFVSEANIFSEWLANIGGKEAKQNVAHLFCELAFRMGAARSESFSFRLPIRQGQIAQACGVSAVHINRSLKVLRERELMTCEQYVVHVKSWQGLTAFAEFDPRYLKAIHPLRLTPMRSAP